MHVFRVGYVALIGCPNVGKSTLMNRILGRKLSIVTDKPQTTRNRILGVKTTAGAQVIYLDTPGVHRPRHRLNRIMVKTAMAALEDADLILHMVEPRPVVGPGDTAIVEKLAEVGTPAFLVINKIDTVAKPRLLPVIQAYKDRVAYLEVLPVSARTGDGVEHLEEEILGRLPPGDPLFPEGTVTDLPERFLVGEIVREKILRRTREEIPYAVAVKVEAMERRGDRLEVQALIYVDKESQKGILIGRGGRMLREIGTAARREIEAVLGCRAFLGLWVKVRPGWRSQLRLLGELGFQE